MEELQPPPISRAATRILGAASILLVLAVIGAAAWGINHAINHTHRQQPVCYSQSGGALDEDVCP